MDEKRTEYIPKYVNSSSLEKVKKTILEEDIEEHELKEGYPEDIVKSLKKEVEEEIDSEHKKYEYFYVQKDKEHTTAMNKWKDKTRNKEPEEDPEEEELDEEDVEEMDVEEIQDVAEGRKTYNPKYSSIPRVKITKFPLENIALIAALFLPHIGIVLGIITIITSKKDRKKKMKGILAMIISITIFITPLRMMFMN